MAAKAVSAGVAICTRSELRATTDAPETHLLSFLPPLQPYQEWFTGSRHSSFSPRQKTLSQRKLITRRVAYVILASSFQCWRVELEVAVMACGAVGRLEVLRLYRQLLREGRRFADYNFRCLFLFSAHRVHESRCAPSAAAESTRSGE